MFSRFTFYRSLRITGVLCALYFIAISVNAIAIYKYRANNMWTHAIEEIFPYPAAIVNQEVITLNRFRKEVAARKHVTEKNGIPFDERELEKTIVERLVSRILYTQALKEHDIEITDADVESSLQGVYEQIEGKENLSAFLASEYGNQINLSGFRVLMREFLEQSALENELLMHAQVRHILISLTAEATDEQVQQAHEKILKIREQLTDSTAFSDVAKQESEDIATRDSGGELGTSSRGKIALQFSQEFEDVIFDIPVGEISQPVRSRHGWHLIIVDKREGVINQSLEQYTQQLREEANVALFVGK